jgi:hypothetical protein
MWLVLLRSSRPMDMSFDLGLGQNPCNPLSEIRTCGARKKELPQSDSVQSETGFTQRNILF